MSTVHCSTVCRSLSYYSFVLVVVLLLNDRKLKEYKFMLYNLCNNVYIPLFFVSPMDIYILSYLDRYAGAPIDFETVEINSSTTDARHLQNALLSVQRNGVALKGQYRNCK